MKNGTLKPGRLIVIDGPDGAGKSTQVKLLRAALEKHGVVVNDLREPGGTPLGEAIRALLLGQEKIPIDPLAETFLFQAARAQLVRQVIRPTLEKGEWIVCDRFTLSTLVYQGYAGGVKKKTIKALSAAACDGLKPDAYLVLWVPPMTSTERRADRKADRMESKGDAYHECVAKGFLKEAKRHGGKYTWIDGSGAIEDVSARIWKEIKRLVKTKK